MQRLNREPDGLTTDSVFKFYGMPDACINNKDLLPTMKQGLIILIPKPEKIIR